MARRRHPLVPLDLFRIRRFAIINLSTLLIYAALYVNLTFQSLMLQNVLGYTATASGAVGLPVWIILTRCSGRAGAAAGRSAARPSRAAGPPPTAAAPVP